MTYRQTLAVALLTALYLCCELAFNARLLDVVGGSASPAEVHHIEIFGRGLSGIAVALVLLQLLLSARARSGRRSPSAMAMLFWCLLSAGLVYGSLQLLVDHLVARSDAQMRRTSLTIVLVQRALVNGQVQLDGLDDDPGLFARPEGKAFLALFPAMAVSVERLDDKVRDVKLELISRGVLGRLGQAQGVYRQYEQAVARLREQYDRYRRAPGPVDLEAEIPRRQDEAWNDYLADLGKRGWTPSTVPAMARRSVLQKVRARVPVPADWQLGDEAGFREAVATQVRRQAGQAAARLVVGGQPVPAGLGWEAFFGHAGVQAELRKRLQLPARVTLLPAYGSAELFEKDVVRPLVREVAQRELAAYEAPVKAFEPGGVHFRKGEDAARAVIVPPVALFFSLLGAIGHLAKLVYLLLRLATGAVPAWRGMRRLWLVPVGLLAASAAGLSLASNAVTDSRLYGYMHAQVLHGAGADAAARGQARALLTALHWVAVGQGLGYPVNEWVRTRVLHNFDFGYERPSR
ncbi:MAG: hypothetical protein ACK4R2_10690 [Roseateles sp.]